MNKIWLYTIWIAILTKWTPFSWRPTHFIRPIHDFLLLFFSPFKRLLEGVMIFGCPPFLPIYHHLLKIRTFCWTKHTLDMIKYCVEPNYNRLFPHAIFKTLKENYKCWLSIEHFDCHFDQISAIYVIASIFFRLS